VRVWPAAVVPAFAALGLGQQGIDAVGQGHGGVSVKHRVRECKKPGPRKVPGRKGVVAGGQAALRMNAAILGQIVVRQRRPENMP
jgi:hypothetical protein